MKSMRTLLLAAALLNFNPCAASAPEPTYDTIEHTENKIVAKRSDGISYILTYNNGSYRGLKILNKKINPSLKGPEFQNMSSVEAQALWFELLALLEIS